MGTIPEKAARRVRRKSRLANVNSSADMDWRHRQSMREVLAEERGELQDGRLPAIQEDKLYPRRTLESAEVWALREEAALQQHSESPELGPPPVAHFDDVPDPIRFDAPTTSEVDNESDVIQLPGILERRRRRRTSALLQDMPTEETLEPEQPAKPAAPMLKLGAKRKLDVSELEEPRSQPNLENDDFVFQRRQEVLDMSTGGKKSSRFSRPPGRENENAMESSASQKSERSPRKVLAPKSTNSPAKRRVHVTGKLDVLKDDRDGQQGQAGNKPTRRANFPPQIDTRDGGDPNDQEPRKHVPPKTPAAVGDDILSPMSTEPSVRTAYQAKEAAILNSVEDVLNGSIGRGSRRARPAISYAEPNLRDKMRRPGKELVGAVEGIEKARESGANGDSRAGSVDRARPQDEKDDQDRAQVVRNKADKDGRRDERWRELPLSMSKKEDPTSPLRDKERKEKERSRLNSKIDHRATDEEPQQDLYVSELERGVDRLSIFDPPVSSPIEETKVSAAAKDGGQETTAPGGARRKPSAGGPGRRHSVQSSSSSITSATGEASKGSKSSSSSAMDSKLTARAHPPRPNSAASLSRSLSNTPSAADLKNIKRSNSVASRLEDRETVAEMETSTGGAPGNATSSSTSAGSRAERSLNRRRSMMV